MAKAREKWAALVRGVNVTGANKLPMKAWREVLEDDLGLTEVETYLQSGNAVFRAPAGKPEALAKKVGASLEERFGLQVAATVVTASALRTVQATNPFVARAAEPTHLHTCFLIDEPDGKALKALAPPPGVGELHVGPGVIYLYLPEGMGRAKLNAAYLEKKLRVPVTARNWRTVAALVELTTG